MQRSSSTRRRAVHSETNQPFELDPAILDTQPLVPLDGFAFPDEEEKPVDPRLFQKVLEQLVTSRNGLVDAQRQIGELDALCNIKDKHILGLRQKLLDVEAERQKTKGLLEKVMKDVGKEQEPRRSMRPASNTEGTREAKIQTKLQSQFLDMVLDKADVQIDFNVASFVQEENEDSDETRIMVTPAEALVRPEMPSVGNLIDITVSRYKTLSHEVIKEKDALTLCRVCSYNILRMQLEKEMIEADDELELHDSNDDINDNMLLNKLFDDEFVEDVDEVRGTMISRLTGDLMLRTSIIVPNSHSMLREGIYKLCAAHPMGQISFSNPYITESFKGNYCGVFDAPLPKSYRLYASDVKNRMLMEMYTLLILRQRLRFNAMVSQKIPNVLFAQSAKDTNIRHVEAAREHYLKYFRDFREYREITEADLRYEQSRTLTNRYYENCHDKPVDTTDICVGPGCGSSVLTGSMLDTAIKMSYGSNRDTTTGLMSLTHADQSPTRSSPPSELPAIDSPLAGNFIDIGHHPFSGVPISLQPEPQPLRPQLQMQQKNQNNMYPPQAPTSHRPASMTPRRQPSASDLISQSRVPPKQLQQVHGSTGEKTPREEPRMNSGKPPLKLDLPPSTLPNVNQVEPKRAASPIQDSSISDGTYLDGISDILCGDD